MNKVKIWDPAVRVFHWGLGALVLAAFLTAGDDDALSIHVKIGMVVLGAVVFRVGWGVWGSTPARFSSFVRSPRAVVAYARGYVRGRPAVHQSHNPLGAIMVVALLATLLGTVATGVLAYAGPEHGGMLAGTLSAGAAEDMEDVHEGLASLLLWLIGLHVAGVIVSSLLERQNLILGMITGRKRPAGPPPAPNTPVRTAAGLLGAALLGYAIVRAVMTLFPVPEAEAQSAAETPAALLGQYEREAAKEQGFSGADAARGRMLYTREVGADAAARACTSCHTSDPRQPGRTPVGKSIAPLAPAANRAAFTSRKKADKWFDRNCKQVFGRVCTPAEKSHLLKFLLAQ
jgi:cytochrome b